MKDGHTCGMLEFDPCYVGIDLVDFKSRKNEKVIVGTEPGYTITGDQSSWISNDTTRNKVDIAISYFDYGDYFTW